MSTEIKLYDWEEYYDRMYKKTGNKKYNIKRQKISKQIDSITGMAERLKFKEDVTDKIGESLKNTLEKNEKLRQQAISSGKPIVTANQKSKVSPNARYGTFVENGKIIDVKNGRLNISDEEWKRICEEREK